MSRFWGGFGIASILWVAAGAYLVLVEGFAPPEAAPVDEAEAPPDPEPGETAPEASDDRRGRRGRRAHRPAVGRGRTPTGDAVSGDDDLGEDEMRTLDVDGTGGEQQLRPAQIEAGFDRAMGRIRRCLVLVEGDDEVRGTVTFAIRITSSGAVERVQLRGPRAVTTGEAGGCLQGAVRAIRFDSFDGPPMVVRYPLTLE